MGILEEVVERLDHIEDRLQQFSFELQELRRGSLLTQEWYSRKEACAIKGVSLAFCEQNTYHFPAFGESKKISRGRYGFRREDVRVWLPKTYDEIEEEWKQLGGKRKTRDAKSGGTRELSVVGGHS